MRHVRVYWEKVYCICRALPLSPLARDDKAKRARATDMCGEEGRTLYWASSVQFQAKAGDAQGCIQVFVPQATIHGPLGRLRDCLSYTPALATAAWPCLGSLHSRITAYSGTLCHQTSSQPEWADATIGLVVKWLTRSLWVFQPARGLECEFFLTPAPPPPGRSD